MNYFDLNNSSWLVIAVIFSGLIFYLVYMRSVESRRVEHKFGKDEIIISSFGVNYFGRESEPGRPLRSSGVLVLLKNGLYYRARWRKRELFILGSTITYIGVSDVFKKKSLYQHAVLISFLNKEGKDDKAAFRIPYPSQWINAIKFNLLNKKAEITDS